MNYDQTDALDDRYTVQVQKTALMIAKHMKQGVTTVGAIKRALPEPYTPFILSALKDLKLVGELDYDEHSAAPTKIHPRSMRMVTRKRRVWNGGDAAKKVDVQPFPEVMYGDAFKGQL